MVINTEALLLQLQTKTIHKILHKQL